MASITIRNLDESLKIRLKARATEHGCSMEEEARRVLRESLDRQRPETLGDIARELFGPKNGVELEPHPPATPPDPPDFSDE
jgi:plasmid stability protein